MPLKVWDGANWTMAGQMKVWNGSAWTQLQAGKVWDGSSWVQFHPGVQLNEYTSTGVGAGIVLLDSNSAPYTADAAIALNAGGTADYTIQGASAYSYSWLLSGAASDYYAFMDTPSSGSFSSGTTNSALQLNTTRLWTVSKSTIGAKQVVSTLRIRTASDVDIVTISVDLTAEVTP